MNEDLREPIEQQLYPRIGSTGHLPSGDGAALPSGALTASVLLDVLALVADSPNESQSYIGRAVELLKVGLGASVSVLGLGLIDALNVPAATPAGKVATRRMAIDGAVVALYLLALAARQKQLGSVYSAHASADSGAIGLSLVGLMLLGASGKLR